MTIVRQIDVNGDWTFGKGRNNYLKGNDAVAQNIETRLRSFLGNCFFDLSSGIDWFNLLGSKDQQALNLAISSTILNTPNVTGINELSSFLDPITRNFTVRYNVNTSYSVISSTFQLTGVG